MVSSIGEAAAQLRSALAEGEGVAAALSQIAEGCARARGLLAAAGEGSSHPAMQEALHLMAAAVERVEEAAAAADAGNAAVRDYLEVLGVEGGPGQRVDGIDGGGVQSVGGDGRAGAAVTDTFGGAVGQQERPESGERQERKERQERLRQAVVEAGVLLPVRQEGSPTRGFVLDEDGTALDPVALVSGTDRGLVTDLALVGRERLASSQLADVESKVAARIRRGELPPRVVLVLNNAPCVGPLGCREMLPRILPRGSRVSVYVAGRNGTQLYGVYEGNGSRIKR